MDCSTIIVSYNTFDFTREAVRSALHSATGLAHEVIVVDNASPDESARRLREALPPITHPNVHVIANPDNRGFSAANNQGAAHARGRVLFFLNPDTVVHADTIPQLVALLDTRPDVGAAGPRVFNADGTDQRSVYPFHTAAELLRQYLPALRFTRERYPKQSGPVDVVKGCALALRRDAFDAVGGWDEAYFMYSEETELCWQLHARGLRSYFLREAVITHYGGAASRERYVEQQVMGLRSTLYFLRRHGSPAIVAVNRAAGTVGFAVRAVAFHALAALRPTRAEDYRLRGRAASAVWRWFLFDYA